MYISFVSGDGGRTKARGVRSGCEWACAHVTATEMRRCGCAAGQTSFCSAGRVASAMTPVGWQARAGTGVFLLARSEMPGARSRNGEAGVVRVKG